MLHNEITSEREREIFKVNYAVVVVAFYCQTHNLCAVRRCEGGIVLDNRRGHSQRMNACTVVKKLFIYDIFIIIVIVYTLLCERLGVGEIEILTHLR